MEEADRSVALDSIGFGFAPAFSSLGFEAARDQVSSITEAMSWGNTADMPVAITSSGAGNNWAMADGLYGIASISGSTSSYDPTSTSFGYDVDLASLTVGVEKLVSGTNTSFGVALGYTDGSADSSNGLGDIDADGYSVTAFTRTRFGDGGLVQALIGYQNLSYDSSRYVLGETARGETDGSQVFAVLNVTEN